VGQRGGGGGEQLGMPLGDGINWGGGGGREYVAGFASGGVRGSGWGAAGVIEGKGGRAPKDLALEGGLFG